ncbi:hypothetical protein H5410_017764 [Solanum commersonii]|uniref:GRF-type domain-containing protein n=1 Tax=Solanum commersonii TaxID=4109 RepID=A0A9J6A1A4_SOLCO|nr:hypothetical protein H5410_017764 [Solanum commersonii]
MGKCISTLPAYARNSRDTLNFTKKKKTSIIIIIQVKLLLASKRVMTKFELNKLCMDENDSMINVETSWSDRNLGRRFWSCPHYEAMNCNFFRWRDKERVDERSRFILPKLVNRIKELEEKYERVKMQLEQLDNSQH